MPFRPQDDFDIDGLLFNAEFLSHEWELENRWESQKYIKESGAIVGNR